MAKSTQWSVCAGFAPALCALSLLAGCASSPPGVATEPRPVTRENFVRAPTPLDQQTVVRMNRDTLYSAAIIDTTNGGAITLPPCAGLPPLVR